MSGRIRWTTGRDDEEEKSVLGEALTREAGGRNYASGADAFRMDDADYQQLQKYQEDWQTAHAAGNAAGEAAAHDSAEALRKKYGYSGGTNGDEFIKVRTPAAIRPFTYEGASEYLDGLRDRLDTLENSILNREPFSYDHRTDPAWQAYKKQYTREGQRGSEDVMGQYAALTGGMPSTAAVTAAQQAQNYYNAQMTDKIPELYQLAYEMYQNEGNQLRNNWSMLNSSYARELDRDSANRAFAWQQYTDRLDRERQAERDAVSDDRYDDETAYSRERDALSDQWNAEQRDYARAQADRQEAMNRIAAYLEAGGTVEGLQADSNLSALAESAGYGETEMRALQDYAAQQAAIELYKATKSGGSSSGGGGSGKSAEKKESITGNSKVDDIIRFAGTDKDRAHDLIWGGNYKADTEEAMQNLYDRWWNEQNAEETAEAEQVKAPAAGQGTKQLPPDQFNMVFQELEEALETGNSAYVERILSTLDSVNELTQEQTNQLDRLLDRYK